MGWAEAGAEHNDIVLFVSLANNDEEEEGLKGRRRRKVGDIYSSKLSESRTYSVIISPDRPSLAAT